MDAVKIFVFLTGEGNACGFKMWTACAITEHGRWIAGAVSQESDIVALMRCQEMAIAKAPNMLSVPANVQIVHKDDTLLRVALHEAFKRLP